MARDRVSINIPSWREVKKDEDACAGIKNDILRHFILKDPRKDAQQLLERAALMTAGKAWKQWKCTLVKEYVTEGVTPFHKYRQIKEETCEVFKKTKTSEEFKLKSKAAKLLAEKYCHPHKMGTTGYAGMAPIWAMEDADAEAHKLPKLFGHIRDTRARNWARARVSRDKDTGFAPMIVDQKD